MSIKKGAFCAKKCIIKKNLSINNFSLYNLDKYYGRTGKATGERWRYVTDNYRKTETEGNRYIGERTVLYAGGTAVGVKSEGQLLISGTNGLLGAADGAFVMQKEKRTDNKAVLEVAGRDQQDQRLLLDFDREQCVWKLTKAETELWKEPADPVLEAIAKVVSEEQPLWSGTASELLQLLPDLDMQPNVLTRKLNIGAEQLFVNYGIRYASNREHSGRMIKLEFIKG